jgi:hypothetical protein
MVSVAVTNTISLPIAVKLLTAINYQSLIQMFVVVVLMVLANKHHQDLEPVSVNHLTLELVVTYSCRVTALLRTIQVFARHMVLVVTHLME